MPLVRDVAPAPDLGAPPQGVSLPTGKRGAVILEPGPQQPPQIFSGGPVSDIFDVALAGQYAAAGVATGKGIRRGVLERTSYGELLPEEFRTTKLGRVTEFGMNVVGDPLTYTPMGWIGRGVKAIPGARVLRAPRRSKPPRRSRGSRRRSWRRWSSSSAPCGQSKRWRASTRRCSVVSFAAH